MKRKLASYLFERLYQCGAELTFGIPGDFALPLYAQQDEYGMKTVVCTHEPHCVFAADAYSRLKGLGAVLTTYGVGGLNMVNPVAMAYAERSPVVIISGAPALAGRKREPAFHHLVKDYGSQQRVFAEVTCATAALTDTLTAAEEIDRVLETCLFEKRPGYIEIPIDMTAVEIEVKQPELQAKSSAICNQEATLEAVREIITRLSQAENPVLYAGVGIRRHDLMRQVCTIAENWGLPVVSSVMGKGSFPESHPHFAGVYMGEMGSEQTRSTLENADLILAVGVIFSDVNTGFWTADIDQKKLIDMRDVEVKISYHSYVDVPLGALVTQLAAEKPDTQKAFSAPTDGPAIRKSPPANQEINTVQLIQLLQNIDLKSHSILADVGDAWFAGLELQADTFMAPGYYASMGFAVPGSLGAGLAAPELRPIVLVGDGAFQMTGGELSTLIGHNLNPLVIVLNNGYYKMLSALDRHREYYNLNNWDYVRFAQALGCDGVQVKTFGETSEALQRALGHNTPYLIEVVLRRDDHAPVMQRIREYFHTKPS